MASGKCVPRPSSCPRLWAPQCCCDGKTYANDCERLRAGAAFSHKGECKKDRRRGFPFEVGPVWP